MRLGAATADAARVVAHLVQEMGTVVTENVLSGPGLARLHRILTDRHESAEEIATAARKRDANRGRADIGDKRGFCHGLRDSPASRLEASYATVATTPPSTRSEAPVVADASFEQT
jgi:hypothetical protein